MKSPNHLQIEIIINNSVAYKREINNYREDIFSMPKLTRTKLITNKSSQSGDSFSESPSPAPRPRGRPPKA